MFDYPTLFDWWTRTKRVLISSPFAKLFPDVQTNFSREVNRMDQLARSPCLDIGGGRGEAAFTLSGRGLFVVSLDRSKTQCDLLRRKYPGLAVVRGDANRLPFKDQAFQTTSYRTVIHHLETPLQAMLEARRVSRESLILDVIADNRLLVNWLQKIWLFVQDDRARLFDESEWKALMKAAGAVKSRFSHGASIQYFLFAHVYWPTSRLPDEPTPGGNALHQG
jgi:ubiquinone/menaquinone biosynthesis C-methylase UbiE